MDKIITQVKVSSELVKWSNSFDVVRWFERFRTTCRDRFIQFNIEDFYTSISKDLLFEALDFGNLFCEVTDLDRDIILHAKKTLLFSRGDEWIKSDDIHNGFDVSMGSFDGGSVCDQVGYYLMDLLGRSFPDGHFGIYKDGNLEVSLHTNGPVHERLKKGIVQIVKDLALKIVIDSNFSIVNFMDVSLNIVNNTYEPFRKANDRLCYINAGSCYPSLVFRNLVRGYQDFLPVQRFFGR